MSGLIAQYIAKKPDLTIASLVFDDDHPVFPGHFPGRPIVPGVMLLDRVQRIIESKTGISLSGLPAAKFLSPTLPGDALELEYEITKTVAHFELRSGSRRIANGRFDIKSDAVV